MSRENDFERFLHNIEPSSTTKKYISSIQSNLREYLENHSTYKNKLIDTFLTGSYAKHTSIRPTKFDGKTDVDIVVVTNYTESDDSKEVLDELYKVCKEKYLKVTKQSRSIGIEMQGIEVDVVPMIEDNLSGMYKIGNKKDGTWKKTNPKGHINWCINMNKDNNDKFVRIVKIFKWWRKNNCPDTVKYPKGITLEKIVADNLYDCNNQYEKIVFNTMKNIQNAYEQYIETGIKPFVSDPGIPSNNLSDSYEFNDFKSFFNKIKTHIKLLEEANFSNEAWRRILGTEFSKDESSNNSLLEALTERYNSFFNVPYKEKPIWYEGSNTSLVDVKVKCYDEYNNLINYNPDGDNLLSKNLSIDFSIVGAAAFSSNTKIYWQVVNTGEEARSRNCLRGGFENSNIYNYGRHECTAYTGTHWVQAFIVNNGECIAKSKEILVKIK
ncbi:MAG TPA: hypothetical protein OIM60_03135 [Clostridiaceae bacterium]|nr:hypothetical protein [Clostridiaceae bacterium]